MNKYQEERKDVFRNAAFSSERKEAVLYEMNRKKKVMWQPIAAFVVVACIALFFILSNSTANDITKSAVDRSTLEGYFESLYNNNEQDEKMTLLFHQQNIFQENDAVLISFYPSDSAVYYVKYIMFENKEWHMKGSTGVHLKNDGSNYNIINFDNTYIYIGALLEEFKDSKVFVGKEEAIVLEDNQIQPIWIQKGNSSGTPVFRKKGNELTRIMAYDSLNGSSKLPMLDAIGENLVIHNTSNSMHGVDDTYMDYPLIIEVPKYSTNTPSIGDVILINSLNSSQLVRVKGIGPANVVVTEGSVLLDGFFFDANFMIASENGNIHVDYSNMYTQVFKLNENQYFVQSDNWASEDYYEGIIMEEDIVGKVIGYSLLDIEPNWTNEEIDLYEQYKKELDDRLLVNIDPQTIFRLQKYAITHKDYRAAYALFDKDSIKSSYEDWAESESMVNAQVSAMNKRHIYDAHLIQNAIENKTGNELTFTNPKTSKKIGTVIYKDGAYKVKYEQITDLTLN